MLIIVIASILILNAIFWGLIPVSKHSPHQMMLDFFQINYKPDVYFHLFIGTTFYILAVYFGSVKIKKIRYAASVGLIADFVGIVSSIFLAYIFYT